jgi:hypothetical protein
MVWGVAGLLIGLLISAACIVPRLQLLRERRTPAKPPEATIKPNEPPGVAPNRQNESPPHWPS